MKQLSSNSSIRTVSIFLISLQIIFIASRSTSINFNLDLMDINGYKCFGVTKMGIPIRLNPSGVIECFSTDGKVCTQNFNHDIQCREFVAKHKNENKPIDCDPVDYKNKKHWCYQAHKFFFKKWHCPDETGLKVAVKIFENLDIKCMSNDEKKCIKGVEAMKLCKATNYSFKKLFGGGGDFIFKNSNLIPKNTTNFRSSTSSENKILFKTILCKKEDFRKGNWCARAYGYFKYNREFLCNSLTGLDIAIRLSKSGKVECLTLNGKECNTGLNSDYECYKSVHQLTEGNSVTPKTIKCKSKDDFIDFPWCKSAYNILYYNLRENELHKYRKIMKDVRAYVKKNHKPEREKPWYQLILNFLVSPIARTKTGIKEFKRMLDSQKIDMPKITEQNLIKSIRRGEVTSKFALKRAMDKIVKFKTRGVKIDLKINSKKCYKKTWDKLSKMLKRKDLKKKKVIDVKKYYSCENFLLTYF
jgi:hypothetical protein